jgi:hypothetical protein
MWHLNKMHTIGKRKRLLKQKEALEHRLYDCLQARVEHPELVQAAMSDLQYHIVEIENEIFLLDAMKPVRFGFYTVIVSFILMFIIALCIK